MAKYWDPSELLEVTPLSGHTCTGTTQRGARCQNPVNVADRTSADNILKDLAADNIIVSGLKDETKRNIRKLARLTLCIRFHREVQTADVAAKWFRFIEEYISEQSSILQQVASEEQETANPGVTAAELDDIAVNQNNGNRSVNAGPAQALHEVFRPQIIFSMIPH
jgi:hypothetical protein